MEKIFYITRFRNRNRYTGILACRNTDNYSPKECINFYDCCSYIDSLEDLTGLHFHLPTKFEWLYASDWNFFNSENDIEKLKEYVWVDESPYKVHKTRLLKPNSFGLYDMFGNIFEWTSDWQKNNFSNNEDLSDENLLLMTCGGIFDQIKERFPISWPKDFVDSVFIGMPPFIQTDEWGFRIALHEKPSAELINKHNFIKKIKKTELPIPDSKNEIVKIDISKNTKIEMIKIPNGILKIPVDNKNMYDPNNLILSILK